MTLGRLIYKSLLQITTQYDVSRLPLTGVVGLTEARFRYPPSRLFREAIQTRRQQPDFDAGFRAIKQLQAQYYVLGGAGPVEQVSYAIWHQALSEESGGVCSPSKAVDSLIWGSFVAAKMLRHPHPEEDLAESALEDLHEACQSAHTRGLPVDKQAVSQWSTMQNRLQSLAAEVQNAAPADLFHAEATKHHTPPLDVQQQQLQCITQTLFHKARFRQDPFEWVYEGLSPLDMLDVLTSGKGISLTLAITFAGVARELGIPVSLLPILEAPVPELAIPENIRHRQATQTIATAPEPNAWLVRTEWPAQMAALQHGAKHPEQQTPVPRDMHATNAEELQPCFADPVKGSVMSLADCQAKYPHMQLAAQWRWDVSVLQVLAEFPRVAVTAHQRRGESDAVAFWMYQLMALDCMAPEWQHVMS
ncbi:hypothetical protein WJX82_000627 [Trebouxia sp. C0006]